MRRGSVVSYAVAVLVVLGTVLMRHALSPVLQDRIIHVLQLPAVLVVAWGCGTGPAILAALVAGVATEVLIVPMHGDGIWNTANLLGLVAFLVVCGALIAGAHRIRRLQHELREGDRRKDEFLAMLAHELRNPLAPMKLALEVTRHTDDPEHHAQARAVLDRQLDQLVRLIDDLLDVSRITRGKLRLRREPITLSQVIDAAVEVSRPLIDAHHHTFVVDLPERAVWIDGDLTRLSQVFGNVLTNAAKYTPDGGRIELSARAGGDVRVVVKDSGTGIAPEDLARMFDLFAQLEPLTTRSRGGLGIGLAVVRALVEMHGGTVVARSEGVGRGTEVEVRLPVIEAPAIIEVPAAPTPVPSRPLRVLVADDNRDVVGMVAALLARQGHAVHTAKDGVEALDVAQRVQPDAAILDIGMPGMSGYDVARRLRDAGAELRLIALTGWGQQSDRARSREAGFDLHLTKPASPQQLLEALDTRRA